VGVIAMCCCCVKVQALASATLRRNASRVAQQQLMVKEAMLTAAMVTAATMTVATMTVAMGMATDSLPLVDPVEQQRTFRWGLRGYTVPGTF